MDTKLCHIFTHFFCNKAHEVFDIFRFAAETLTKLRILGCDTNRTSIQIADTHHHTAHRYKRCCCKAIFLSTQKCCDHNVTTAHQLTVRLDDDLISQSVHDQCLVCLGKTKLPRKTCIVDGVTRCSSCTAVITGNKDYLCTGFCHTCCNCSDTGFRYEFDRNTGIFIGIFQVVDQLRQIFDRINIMMRWRGDQADTRCGMTCLCNPWIYLACRQMSAFTRFCALCHFDLDFLCTGQIFTCYTKTSTCYLLDRRAFVQSVRSDGKPLQILAAFTGIGFTAQVVHSYRQAFMCFL